MKIIAYHGSQQKNIKLSNRPLYLVDDKSLAENWANGYAFGGDLQRTDFPTVYTIEIAFNNPKYIYTEEEYDELMDITNWEIGYDNTVREKLKGYDGLIYEDDCTYYMPFNADKQCKILKEESVDKRLNENLEELETGIYATQSAYDILNWLKNKPKPYRVVYDKNIRTYFICDAYNWIHQDMLEAAYRNGFYPEMYSVGEVQDYIYDTIDNEELLFFAFSPDADKKLDHEKSSDGYTQKYTYDFGAIYAHETTPLENFDFYQLLGKPLNKEFIYESFNALNEVLKQFI